MPRTKYLLSHSRRLALVLALIAILSWLVLPGRFTKWLLPSVSATTTSKTISANNAALMPASPGVISFAEQNYIVNEGDGSASFTLTRTGGSDGLVSAKVTLTDSKTSPADYILSPGALDTTFITPSQIGEGSAGTYGYPTMALQPDGKLLIAHIRGVLRLNTDGSVDETFPAGGATNWGVTCVALQPDGKILIGGAFTTFNNQRANHIARLNSDGSLDTSFDVGTGANESVSVIVAQPDGKVLLSGYFNSFNGVSTGYERVMRLNSDGSIDNSFALGNLPGLAIALQPDGKVLGAGSGGIMRAQTDGTIDSTFNAQFTGSYPFLFNIALQPDGKVLIVGSFDHVGGQVAYGVARLNADGSVDPTFNAGTGPDTVPQGVALEPDGKVLISGSFSSFNGTAANSLVRLNPNGTLDTAFVASISPLFGTTSVNNLLLQPDGKVFIRGYLTAVGPNTTRRYLARLNNDLFVTWAAGDASNKTVRLLINDDLLDEPDETLNLTLVPLTSGIQTGTYSNATLTIVDNDVPPAITSAPPPSLINIDINPLFNHVFVATGYPSPTFTVTSGTLPSGLTLSPTGVLSGVLNRGGRYNNITVTASNGVGTPATQTFSINVNNLPNANSETYATAVNTALTVNAPGLLANDVDANGDPLTAILDKNPANGSVIVNANGSFTYTPNQNFKGVDTFYYRASDGYSTSSSTLVNINVLSGGILQFPTGGTFSVREDAGNIDVQILRSDGSFGTTTVAYSISDGTAQAGSDYTGASGTVTFVSGQLVGTFRIPIINDSVNEADETVNLTLTSVTGTGTLGTQKTAVLTILNDDAPTLQLSQRNYTVSEGAGNLNLPVIRSGDPAIPVTVNYSTSDQAGSLPCDTVIGIASSRCDYAPSGGTLQFAAGETSKIISIPLVDDGLIEGTERFALSLSSPGGASLGSNSSATISITDNDSTGGAPPLSLVLDQSGPGANQAAAVDSLTFLRDPFPVVNTGSLFNQGGDRNTRVIILVTNLQLVSGEPPAAVIVNLVDSNNQSYDLGVEDVRPIPYFNFTQVIFRLPDNLAPGVCSIKVKAHSVVSNVGTMRIRN